MGWNNGGGYEHASDRKQSRHYRGGPGPYRTHRRQYIRHHFRGGGPVSPAVFGVLWAAALYGGVFLAFAGAHVTVGRWILR